MRLLGIDPGLSGALALLTVTRDKRVVGVELHDMPTAKVAKGARGTKTVLQDAELARLVRGLDADRAFVEDVHSMPAQGVVSTFTFGQAFGTARGVLAALELPVDFLEPQAWGPLVRLPRGDDGSRVRAGQLFPSYTHLWPAKRHHGRTDALLIALAGGRMHGLI